MTPQDLLQEGVEELNDKYGDSFKYEAMDTVGWEKLQADITTLGNND